MEGLSFHDFAKRTRRDKNKSGDNNRVKREDNKRPSKVDGNNHRNGERQNHRTPQKASNVLIQLAGGVYFGPQDWWNKKLEDEGMGEDVGYENDPNQINIGHGVKSERWEQREDNGEHSPMCPINLGRGDLDQPNDRPTERYIEP